MEAVRNRFKLGLCGYIKHVKERMKATFGEHCKTRFHTLMDRLLTFLVEDLKRFGNQEIMDESLLKIFNVYIKCTY